jgi:streptogramin lyase
MLADGSMVAGQWHGAVGELAGATGRASGKAIGSGAHPSSDATERRWRMLWAATFISGEGASVAGGDGDMTM